MSSKTVSLNQIDNMYGRGQLSMFEWFDYKDRYENPKEETSAYYRTCLYPVFGKRSHHLGKIELWYALKCVQNGWKDPITRLRMTIEKREQDERLRERKASVTERHLHGR